MRALVQPPPSTKCNVCGGELRLKRVAAANRDLELDSEIFECANCRREHSFIVAHNKYSHHYSAR